jgi:ubiquitin carboxyl-terminal hydrolase 4/11/15
VSPHQLKATLGRINPEYAGLTQQDAHELIELLLDKLHEDLNRVKKKPYTEKVEWDGAAPESEVAEQSWATHGRREDSVVRDLMGSLMRYQLTCADCGKVSLSFEYHTTLQVLCGLCVCARSFANHI